MQTTNPEIDLYLKDGCGRCSYYQTPHCKVHTWAEELDRLREILLTTELKEELKWKQPCYTFNGSNVLIMTAFKDFACISFFKGSLMKDKEGLLVSPGENSQAVGQLRFTDAETIDRLQPVIRAYIQEAIELEKSGKKVEFKQKTELVFPEELLQRMNEDAEFKVAFEALTPGRQRGYNIFFSQPKQSATRASRIEKCAPQILQGKGLHDR